MRDVVNSQLQSMLELKPACEKGGAFQEGCIKVPPSSSLNSAVLLEQLRQQLQEQQQQHLASKSGDRNSGTDKVSVGCQTRQGDSWRAQSTGCQGIPRDTAQAWVQHGMSIVVHDHHARVCAPKHAVTAGIVATHFLTLVLYHSVYRWH